MQVPLALLRSGTRGRTRRKDASTSTSVNRTALLLHVVTLAAPGDGQRSDRPPQPTGDAVRGAPPLLLDDLDLAGRAHPGDPALQRLIADLGDQPVQFGQGARATGQGTDHGRAPAARECLHRLFRPLAIRGYRTGRAKLQPGLELVCDEQHLLAGRVEHGGNAVTRISNRLPGQRTDLEQVPNRDTHRGRGRRPPTFSRSSAMRRRPSAWARRIRAFKGFSNTDSARLPARTSSMDSDCTIVLTHLRTRQLRFSVALSLRPPAKAKVLRASGKVARLNPAGAGQDAER
jgi:hypothetical protein